MVRKSVAGSVTGVDARLQRFAEFHTSKTLYSTLAYGHSGKPKVLYYSVRALINRGALVSAFVAKGTIFTMDRSTFWSFLTYMSLGTLAAAFTYMVANKSDLEDLDLLREDFKLSNLNVISNYLNSFLPFVLGLYISLVLARWWTLRIKGVGKVLDALQNVVLLSSTLLPSEDFAPYRDQIIKYGLASVSLVVDTCRGKRDMEHLGPEGDELLTEEELRIISDVPVRPRAALLWGWILALSSKLFEEQGIPPGKARDVVAQCIGARNATTLIWTFLGTQLPFAYVHLVTFIVNLNNIIVSMKCGVVFIAAMHNDDWLHAGSQVFFLALYPLLYQGLLSIAYMIHDPFGEDLLDFPVMAFQEYANAQSVTVSLNCDRCPASKRTWGSPATVRELALRKQTGTKHADLIAQRLAPVAAKVHADDTDDARSERELVLCAEIKSRIAEEYSAKDEVLAKLDAQRRQVEAQMADFNVVLGNLEQRPSAVAPPPANQAWCQVQNQNTAPLVPMR